VGYLHGLAGAAPLALIPRAAAWLALLGPLFFLTYNWANRIAAARPDVPSIVFAWERHIPFLPWTIVPYWSSDLLYAASFLFCRTREDMDRHGLRLLAIQVISVSFFALFPLQMTFQPPSLDSFFAIFFKLLFEFDRPFNQAPSLHISLAYILSRKIRGPVAAAWFLLIAVSTLTTWQHHFIDVPTGLWAGILVVALLPDRSRQECRRPRLALCYGAGAAVLTWAAFHWQGWTWLLLWPAFSLSLVAAAYATGNVETLGKRGGRMPFWMLPYWVAAWVNSRMWKSAPSEIAGGVWAGRPATEGFASVVDLTGELPVQADNHIPMLDLAPPSKAQLEAAVAAIEALSTRRPTLVCCAIGYSRSAAAVAAWLYATGRAETIAAAVDQVRRARPQVVVGAELMERLQQWAESRNGG
jgi:hypothetical protein